MDPDETTTPTGETSATRDDGGWVVSPGTDVVDSRGSHVGRVDDIRDGYLVVRKGRFFAADYFIPFSTIGSHDQSTIYLNVEADERATRIWHQRPQAAAAATGTSGAPSAMDTEERLEWLTDGEGNVRVPVLKEELSATRRPVVRGSVRIETRITEQDETLEVPVTEERVRVERRRFDADGTPSEVTLDGGTFEVPFYGEDVDVERRVRVIEEIVITREAVESVRRVRGTVRTEEVTIDDGGVPVANRDAAPSDVTTGDEPIAPDRPAQRGALG